jgi:membrane-bound metal-dependent hydrolase YbcI (DUF457 family)
MHAVAALAAASAAAAAALVASAIAFANRASTSDLGMPDLDFKDWILFRSSSRSVLSTRIWDVSSVFLRFCVR